MQMDGSLGLAAWCLRLGPQPPALKPESRTPNPKPPNSATTASRGTASKFHMATSWASSTGKRAGSEVLAVCPFWGLGGVELL